MAWSLFEGWDCQTRRIFIDGMLSRCSWPQLPYTSNLLNQVLFVDFLAFLPTELALKILSHLDATSLCRICCVCVQAKQTKKQKQKQKTKQNKAKQKKKKKENNNNNKQINKRN